MSGWQMCSVFARAWKSRGSTSRRTGRIFDRAGRAQSSMHEMFDKLEPRVLLSGDPINFADAVAVPITAGYGFEFGEIEITNPYDLFSFTAAETDFIGILADAQNTGSGLNTALEIYDADENLLPFFVQNGPATGNGLLTSGRPTDAWHGFLAEAGETYFVRVFSEIEDTAAPGALGEYILRLRTGSQELEAAFNGTLVPEGTNLDPTVGPLEPVTGELGTDDPARPGERFSQDELYFRYTVPFEDDPRYEDVNVDFESLVTGAVQPLGPQLGWLDARLEVYDAEGNFVVADSQSNHLTSPFLWFDAEPGDTFYFRVRSDEFRDPDVVNSTGAFRLIGDAAATELVLDRISRIFTADAELPTAWSSLLFRFTTVAEGRAILTAVGLMGADVRMRLLDTQGEVIIFIDDLFGNIPQIDLQLEGGQEYFLIIDGPDQAGGKGVFLAIEANHTNNTSGNDPDLVDDHPNTPDFGTGEDPTPADVLRRAFSQATPLNFGPASPIFDSNGNPVLDLSYRVSAQGRGRLADAGDSDLFQFVAPLDMIGTHEGDNDSEGQGVFMGGRFGGAWVNSTIPVASPSLVNYDAGSFWFVGPNPTYTDNEFGMFPNGQDEPEIYAMKTVSLPAQQGVYEFLVIGGDFELVWELQTPFGPVPVSTRNIAAWQWNGQEGRYSWATNFALLNPDGPVYALETYLPETWDPDGSDGPLPPVVIPDNQLRLAIGGDFSEFEGNDDFGVDPIAANSLADINIAPFRAGNFGAIANIGGEMGFGPGDIVYALQAYQPEKPGEGRDFDPGPPVVPGVDDPVERPESLLVGGSFATNDDVMIYSHGPGVAISLRAEGLGINVNGGAVRALAVYEAGFDDDDPRLPGGGNEEDPFDAFFTPAQLVIAGDFTSYTTTNATLNLNTLAVADAGGTFDGNLVFWGSPDPLQDPDEPAYNPRNVFLAPTDSPDGPIYALDVYTPPVNAGLFGGDFAAVDPTDTSPDRDVRPVLVIGGDFTESRGGVPMLNLAFTNSLFDVSAMGPGFDAPVRALRVAPDAQEPGIRDLSNQAGTIDVSSERETLYIGGEFEFFLDDPDNPTLVNRVVRWDVFYNALFDVFFYSAIPLTDPLTGGVSNGIDPNEGTVIYAIEAFNDTNPDFDNSANEWDRNDRHASRAAITISGTTDSFINAFVRIYDSNFNVIYENDTISPPFPDPAGSLDPSRGNPNNLVPAFQIGGDEVAGGLWGGETYYIEVTDVVGTGTGRYTITMTMDGLPRESFTPDQGVIGDVNSRITDPLSTRVPGGFGSAISLATNASGDTSIFFDINTQENRFGINQRQFREHPESGTINVRLTDIGQIFTVDDADLYTFTAQNTGTVEIWVQTAGLDTVFEDVFVDAATGAIASTNRFTKTFDSNLDSALRIFNNDFEQIGYSTTNDVVRGDRSSAIVGTFGERSFTQYDARIVFNAVAGERYFVSVESAQRYVDGSIEDPEDRELLDLERIDYRRATGAYNLLINGPASQASFRVGDRHADALVIGTELTEINRNIATPLDMRNSGPNGFGIILDDRGTPDPSDDLLFDGRILDAADNDMFTFVANNTGQMQVQVARVQGFGNLLPTVSFYTADGLQIASGSSNSQGVATVNVPTVRGEQYYMVVDGIGSTNGRYRILTEGFEVNDDYANTGRLQFAQEITLFDFLGTGGISGNIDYLGDTDLFFFEPFATQNMTIRVESADGVFNPRVRVYEVSEDALGTPVLLRIAESESTASGPFSPPGLDAQVVVPVYTNRVSSITENEYPRYYLEVSGADQAFDQGAYNIIFDFEPTDDHADFEQLLDPATRDLATLMPIDASTGEFIQGGVIEVPTDTDLFRFNALAGGPTRLALSYPNGSTLEGVLTVYIIDPDTDQPVSIASTSDTGVPVLEFVVTRGETYYLVVGPDETAVDPNRTGAYSVTINAPVIDDHANEGEWDLATQIVIDEFTGLGQLGDGAGSPNNPQLAPPTDTDLFTFVTIADQPAGEPLIIRVTPVGSGLQFRPDVTIFDADREEIDRQTLFTPGAVAEFALDGVTADQRFYILVKDLFLSAPPTSQYFIEIEATPGDVTIPVDPSEIDFDNPDGFLVPNSRGNATAAGQIAVRDERDLFVYTAPADGPVFVQIVTPQGSILNATLAVRDQPNETPASLVAFDAQGIPGATADLRFEATEGTTYYLIVDGVGAGTGSYTVNLNGVAPDVITGVSQIDARGYNYRLFYPEGFANQQVDEFLSIANPNDRPVNFSVILRYENFEGGPDRDFILIDNATIAAGSRSGADLSRSGVGGLNGIVNNVPYAIEIVSDGQLAANLSHYDNQLVTGESFTDVLSDNWLFPRIERNPGLVDSFILYYNPHDFDVQVTLTVDTSSGQRTQTQTVGAYRRLGFVVNSQELSLPTGVWGGRVSATPVNPANEAAFEGVVASITHLDRGQGFGYGSLGDPTGGSRVGIVPSITRGDFVTGELAFYNPTNQPVSVQITGSYINANLPGIDTTRQIQPRSTLVLRGSQLGIAANQPIGIQYQADRSISVFASEIQNNDANASLAVTDFGRNYFVGDAFIGKNRAGEIYFETVSLYNPTQIDSTVNLNIYFQNGTQTVIEVPLSAGGFASIDLHTRPEILSYPFNQIRFAVEATSTLPFAFNFVHYDLFLGNGGGGWGTNGAIVGLTNPLSAILG